MGIVRVDVLWILCLLSRRCRNCKRWGTFFSFPIELIGVMRLLSVSVSRVYVCHVFVSFMSFLGFVWCKFGFWLVEVMVFFCKFCFPIFEGGIQVKIIYSWKGFMNTDLSSPFVPIVWNSDWLHHCWWVPHYV